jgi:signal transduction histidine kinase
MEDHHGKIVAENRVGGGAKFTITFPVAGDAIP